MTVSHPFDPVFDSHSRVLILGSFPSVRSREEGFYYGHPQNRFWRVIAAVCHEPLPENVDQKKRLLLAHGIALWDAAASCDIEGSRDSSIRHAVPTALTKILSAADIRSICCNGQTAGKLYQRLQQPLTGIGAVILPSTSPLNAAWSTDRLTMAWKAVLEHMIKEL